MRKFTSVRTGKKYKAMEYWITKCPVCRGPMHWNSYNDLMVVNDEKDDIGFCLKVEYCENCEDYFVHIL